jgi:DNA-binding NarL/FixJ family response regulator
MSDTEYHPAAIRVLLVDDHRILREGVRSLLAAEPEIKVVGEAEDGEGAIAQVERLKPDVVLMDMVMPHLSGLEATARIKELHPEVVILIMSMHDNDEYVRQVIKAGAAGYVLKGVTGDDLVHAIKAVHDGASFVDPAIAAKLVEDYVRRVRGDAPIEPEDLLTPREFEILTLVAEGHSNHEIAKRLFLSKKTVETHRANIMRKLELHDVTELVKYALRRGIIHLD